MLITINGRVEEVATQLSLSGLVLARGLRLHEVAVEHNKRIVPKEQWPNTPLKDNDVIEIVSFVGGGL